MTCSSTFLNYALSVLAETPATYTLMYCNASSKVLPCIRAQLELWRTFERFIVRDVLFSLFMSVVSNIFVIFLDFHSTKQGLPLVDSWSRGLD